VAVASLIISLIGVLGLAVAAISSWHEWPWGLLYLLTAPISFVLGGVGLTSKRPNLGAIAIALNFSPVLILLGLG